MAFTSISVVGQPSVTYSRTIAPSASCQPGRPFSRSAISAGESLVEGFTVARSLAEVFLDFDLDRFEVEAGELRTDSAGEVLRQHFDRRVGDRQDHTVARGKNVARLACIRDADAAVLLYDVELGIVARQQHAVVELAGERAHHLL